MRPNLFHGTWDLAPLRCTGKINIIRQTSTVKGAAFKDLHAPKQTTLESVTLRYLFAASFVGSHI